MAVKFGVFDDPDYVKVRKKANIRNLYNQLPHMNRYITSESDKNTRTSHTREPSGQCFPSRCPQGCKEQKRQYVRYTNPQKKHRLGTVSKKIAGGLKHVFMRTK